MEKMLRPAAAAVGVGAILLFVLALFYGMYYAPQGAPEVVPENAPPVAADPPVRLMIPALKIDAHVELAGLLAGNRMASPTNYADVAWYKYGPTPGSVGSAVIAGHLENGLGLDGVFKNLSDIQVGDIVEVLTESGELLRFAVERTEVYRYTEVPDTVFTASDNRRLNLITCEGKWIKTPNLGWTNDQRLVVYAIFVP